MSVQGFIIVGSTGVGSGNGDSFTRKCRFRVLLWKNVKSKYICILEHFHSQQWPDGVARDIRRTKYPGDLRIFRHLPTTAVCMVVMPMVMVSGCFKQLGITPPSSSGRINFCPRKIEFYNNTSWLLSLYSENYFISYFDCDHLCAYDNIWWLRLQPDSICCPIRSSR